MKFNKNSCQQINRFLNTQKYLSKRQPFYNIKNLIQHYSLRSQQMSQQILRNPTNRSGYNTSNKVEKQNCSSTMTLTKIRNPLNNKLSTNQEKTFSTTNKTLNNQVDMNRQFQPLSKKQNINKNSQQFLVKKQNQQPQYRFYADRFNLSSDDSFMLDQSMRESRKQKLEKLIVQKFKNSRKQIQGLLRRSRERREQRQQQQQQSISWIEDKKVQIKSDNKIKMDKKQAKRKRLNYYHCDSIIIKPQFHPIKVFELSIKPTTNCINNSNKNHNQSNFRQNNCRQIEADESFSSNSKYESVKKSTTKDHKFIDSFNQSPLDKLNQSKHAYYDDVDSPSFLDQRKQRSRTYIEQMSFFKDKQVQKKKKIFHQKDNLLKNTNNQYQQLNFNDKRSRTLSEHQGKSNNNFDKDSQQTVPTHSFKRRNKIFTNDKKSGLKLSRAIRYQQQINKLKGQMGVDVFHIVIQQEEFLRQCCT